MKTEEPIVDFEKSIAPWLGRTMKVVDYHLLETFQKSGLDLTKEQMVILKKLHEKDGRNQNELASITYRDKSSLARLLSKMEKKKFICRRPSQKDKRVNEVFLTSAGKEIFQNSKPHISKLIKRIENSISESEKELIIAILKKVQTNLS